MEDERTTDWRGFYGTDAEWKTAVLKSLDEGDGFVDLHALESE